MVRVSPLLLVLLAAGPGLLLPLPAEDGRGDTQVRKCIVEVISDTLSKPSPLPISQECLETLRGDKRIVSILRHQNLLKELQEIANEGANERNQQQKKNSGFEDELSEVLESQNDNMQRDKGKEIPAEEAAASLAELEAEKMQHNEGENSKEDEKNSLEEREPRPRDVDPEDDKENAEEFESNEIGEAEESPREDALDNHIGDDLSEDEVSEQKHQEDEDQPAETNESLELEEAREKVFKKDQRESKEEEAVEEHAEKDGDRRDTPRDEHPTETEGLFGSNEDESEEIQREDNNEDALGFGKGGRSSEEEEKSYQMKGGRHHSEDEAMQAEDTYHTREVKSEEMEESSKEWGDSKRWNKMDELAKQLTTKKRMEENDSGEDPDRSMKMSFRSRKYDFNSPEEDVRRSWNHHSKEDSSEGFPLAPMPEEKKDEEGSANRRTEDQELESLAAIEAELEKVAHKLHELRRG